MGYAKEDSEINAHYNRGSDHYLSKGFLSGWIGTLSARRQLLQHGLINVRGSASLAFLPSTINAAPSDM